MEPVSTSMIEILNLVNQLSHITSETEKLVRVQVETGCSALLQEELFYKPRRYISIGHF